MNMVAEVDLISIPITTAYDKRGRVIATQLADGRWIEPARSVVGELRENGTMEVAWDGAAPSRLGGFTKGELLGPYETHGGIWEAIKQGLTRLGRKVGEVHEDDDTD